MPTQKTDQEKLDALKAQKKKLDQRIQKHNTAIKEKQRKADTRRKIIVGALALEHAEHDENFAAILNRLIAQHVTRPEDRKLFDWD